MKKKRQPSPGFPFFNGGLLLAALLIVLTGPFSAWAGTAGLERIYLPLIRQPDLSPGPAIRLVVFEGFYDSLNLAAGLVVDQLAQEFSGSPVVFLEYPVADPPLSRISRFYSASTGTFPPLIMIDSGHQFTSSLQNYYSIYKSMVEQARNRPPKGVIQASWERIGDKVRFAVQVTNQSGGPLSLLQNEATVHALVYEETPAGVTSRYVRAAVFKTIITSLADGASETFNLETADLAGVDWTKLHYLALVDYQPGGVALMEPYDILQAAVAQPAQVELQGKR